jgi:hypothetical protein
VIETTYFSHAIDLMESEVILRDRAVMLGSATVHARLSAFGRTHRVKVAGRERSTKAQDLVQALLDRGQLVGLQGQVKRPSARSLRDRGGTQRSPLRTMGMSSSETGSDDEINR